VTAFTDCTVIPQGLPLARLQQAPGTSVISAEISSYRGTLFHTAFTVLANGYGFVILSTE